MLKNITLTLPEEVARWARIKAAENNLSVSKLVVKILEAQMLRSDEYQDAQQRWKEMMAGATLELDAGNRLTRSEANARR